MKKKLWGGRFSKETDALVDDFNSSIRFDSRMYQEDIDGSVAHAGMLGRCGIIPAADAALIQKTLLEIKEDITEGRAELSVDAEDIHMNVETLLIERIGDVGKRLHTGRSHQIRVQFLESFFRFHRLILLQKDLLQLLLYKLLLYQQRLLSCLDLHQHLLQILLILDEMK